MRLVVHLHIPRAHKDQALAFYSEKLGFPMTHGAISVWPSDEVELQLKYVDGAVTPPEHSLFNLRFDGDVSGRCAEWIRRGVEFKAVYMHPGGLTAVVRDPFGNLMEFEGDDEGAMSILEWQELGFFKRF